MNTEFMRVLSKFLEEITDQNIIYVARGDTLQDVWMWKMQRLIRLKYLPSNIDDIIPRENYLGLIKAITCVTNGDASMHRTYYHKSLMCMYHIFLAVTTLSFKEVYLKAHEVFTHMLFSPLYYLEEVYDFVDHEDDCIRGECYCGHTQGSIHNTLTRYIAYHNNLKIHGIWHAWDDHASLAAWLPHEMIVDILEVLGVDDYDTLCLLEVKC